LRIADCGFSYRHRQRQPKASNFLNGQLPKGLQRPSDLFLGVATASTAGDIGNPQSAIRNPQSAIRNPQSAID